MIAIRRWAVFDVYHGTPVLVERCATKEEALEAATSRRPPTGGALYVIEQLLPERALEAKPSGRDSEDFHGTTG
jgi:hypothetical protein